MFFKVPLTEMLAITQVLTRNLYKQATERYLRKRVRKNWARAPQQIS